MKKPLNRFLLPTMAFALTTFALTNTAHAKIPMSRSFSTLSNLEETDLARLLDYRNAKGEALHSKSATTPLPNLWATLDSLLDGVEGTSTEKAYRDSKMPDSGREIIVAVIDGGIDIKHEDLKGKIWVNYAELGGSPGVDDDGNGFVDDIYGWNFLGNKKGENINATTLEVTREYARLKAKQDKNGLTPAEKIYFNQVSDQFDEGLGEAQENLRQYREILMAIQLLKANGLKDESVDSVMKIHSEDPDVIAAQDICIAVFSDPKTNSSEAIAAVIDDLNAKIQYQYNPNFDSSTLVGDHPEILDEAGYGNADVTGPSAMHGTHVAGIIAANRDNNIGIAGQADHVKIMAVRAVPNGDERDKDVANAIYYAVKNGANVINMSFGKPFSPHKSYVDSAVAYAEKHGVIIVHAAGNDGQNTESGANNFPNKKIVVDQGTHLAKNWIEVGASSKSKDSTLAAHFSNWGKTSVDLFAPGVGIVSTVPGNKYRSLDGTSMASPEVAGIAALLMTRFPEKTSTEIIEAMMNTTTQYPGIVVDRTLNDGSRTKVNFADLSLSGGVINTENAMLNLLGIPATPSKLASTHP